MKLKYKLLTILILFFGFTLFSNNDSFAVTNFDNSVGTYTTINFTDKWGNNCSVDLDDFWLDLNYFTVSCCLIANNRIRYVFIGSNSILNLSDGYNYGYPVFKMSAGSTGNDTYYINWKTISSCSDSFVEFNFSGSGFEYNEKSNEDFYNTYFCFSNYEFIYSSFNGDIPVHQASMFNEPDKLDLFTLNLTDLDDDNKVHQFNLATFTDSPCYDEIMEYYNQNYQYAIFLTDYQRYLTYDNENDKNLRYSSYNISGYIDFLVDENAVFYYDDLLGIIGTGINEEYTINVTKDIKKYLKRFYFKYVYSEDSYENKDDYLAIWKNNGNLWQIENYDSVKYLCFVGSSQTIPCSTVTRTWSPIGGLKAQTADVTNHIYYAGYLDPFNFPNSNNITRDVSYIYNFDIEGGTTHIFYLNSSTYEDDIIQTYVDTGSEYGKISILTDTSEGNLIIHGSDSSSSTYDYGDVSRKDNDLDLDEHIGGTRSSSDDEEDTSNWGIIDYLKNIYYFLVGNNIDTSITEDKINSATNTVKNKFNFSANILNNINDMKDVILNTQETQKVYVTVNHKYYSGQVCIVDFSWYEPYKETGDMLICTFAYTLFLWHIFLKLPEIVRGAGAASYSSSYLDDIKAYNSTGFGRSSNIKRR